MPIFTTIVGNIAQDPTIDVEGEVPAFRMLVYVDRFKQTDSGLEELDGFLQRVTYFGDKAKDYHRLLRNGMRIRLEGRVSPNSFVEDGRDDGVEKHHEGFNIVATSISLELGPRVVSIEMKLSRREQAKSSSNAA